MPKDGFVSVTIKESALEIADDLAKVTNLSVPTIIDLALKFYKKEKMSDLKKRARILG